MPVPDPEVELQIGDTYQPITDDVYFDGGISHQRGRSGEGARVDPATVSMRLKSPDGLYSPRNPNSPHYGLIGRNTPIQVSTAGGDTVLRGYGAADDRAFVLDTAALDITGDLDVRADVQLKSWALPDPVDLMGKWGVVGQQSWLLFVFNNCLWLYHTTDGTSATIIGQQSTTQLPTPASGRLAVRATMDVNNGAGGHTTVFYTAPTMAGPWAQLGDAVVTSGTTTIFGSTASLYVINAVNGFNPPSGAAFYTAEVRSGIGGTVVASPDFSALPVGTTSWTDSVGRSWALSGAAEITDRWNRFVVEVSEWSPRWTVGAADVNTPIQGAGLLRRLGQGQKALASTLARRIPSASPLAYWPCEDADGATQAYSPSEGVGPLTVTGWTFGQDSTLGGSAALPSVDAAARMVGNVPAPADAADEWSIHMVYSVDAVPAADGVFLSWRTSGTMHRWRIIQGPDNSTIQGYNQENEVVLENVIGTGTNIFQGWNRIRFYERQNGGSVDWRVDWYDIRGDTGGAGDTFVGSVGRVTQVNTQFSSSVTGLHVGHLAVFGDATPGAYTLADHGFSGETAGARAVRLTTEEGVPFRLIGAAADQAPMGPQRPNTLLELLAECEAADGGILYEDREQIGLVYRGRTTLYNQEPALVLSYGQLSQPFEPVDDDSRIRNDVTRTRTGGSSARAVRDTGPLSVLAPPLGVGIYDESVTLNLDTDDQPEQIAAWALHLGTWDEARYKQVRVLLHKHPTLISAMAGLDIGDVIRITDLPSFLPPGPVDLMVEGYREDLTGLTWDIVLHCSPAGPWSVGVVGDPVLGRADTDGSELAAAVTTTQTGWPITVTDGPTWVRAAAPLNSNPAFADDLTGWTGFGGAVTRVAAPDPTAVGEWALRLVPDGAAQFPNAGGDEVPVAEGGEYTVSGWMRCARSRSIALNTNWFSSGGTYLDTSSNSMAVDADDWTWFESTVTAPVGAVTASIAATVADYPPTTDVLWAHQLTLRPTVDGESPSDFPFAVSAGGEQVTVTGITGTAEDSFTRTVASGWGTANSGQTWTTNGGTAADYAVSGGTGRHIMSTRNISRITTIPVATPDVDLHVDFSLSAVPTGNNAYIFPLIRYTDSGHMYLARIQIAPGGAITMTLRKRNSGETQIGPSYTTGLTYTAGAWYTVRLAMTGSTITGKIWLRSATEPNVWQIAADDTDLTHGSVGVRSFLDSAVTNALPITAEFDNLSVAPEQMTVTRSVNGIVKSQSSGTDIRLTHPTIVAL